VPDRALATTTLHFAGSTRRFCYRAGSASDAGVVKQIFVNGDYTLSGLARGEAVERHYRNIVAGGGKPLVVDAGANIGASTVWFALSFPGSRVVAIEPERGNCSLLRSNCEGLDYELLEGGLSCTDGKMYLEDPGRGDWGFRLDAERGDYAVPTFAAAELVRRCVRDGFTPLVCKVDIEGGEAELFREGVAWVASFPLLIVELHDWLYPGTANSRNFLRTIAALDVDFVYRGENVFCFNNAILRT
jgi:FkbM family methyltransferase